MKLSELFLNRYLYRDNSQNLETKGASFVSSDSSESEPTPIPSGGAANDINTGNVQIDGKQLEPGTYPVTTLDVSNWGWGQTCAFVSASLNTVTWGAGTFTSADGTSYSIDAGTTGVMAAKTYIYLSLLDSETAYQVTTTSSDAVGLGKVLIAVAENGTTDATYMLSEATQIVGDNIIANTIDASKITTGQLIVGTNVGLGSAEDSDGVTTIIGNTVTTGYISALGIAVGTEVAIGSAFAAADAGDLATRDDVGTSQLDATIISGGKIVTGLLTASNIQSGTLSSILIQTSTSANAGIKMSSALGGINTYGQALKFYGTNGTLYGYVYADAGLRLLTTSTYSIYLEPGGNVFINPSSNFVVPTNDNDLYLGASTTSSGGSFGSDKTWKYVGCQILDAKDLIKLNDITVIDQSGTTIYVKSGGGGLVIQDGSTTVATFSSGGGIDLAAGKEIDGQYAHLDCLVLANNSPLNENGAMYSNGTNLYVRLGGSWRTVSYT